MPSPSQTRELRVCRLIVVAGDFLDAGVDTYRLFDRLNRATFHLWPGVREETRKSYLQSAVRAALSRSPVGLDLPPEAVGEIPPWEGA